MAFTGKENLLMGEISSEPREFRGRINGSPPPSKHPPPPGRQCPLLQPQSIRGSSHFEIRFCCRSRESVLHVLAEQHAWLTKYCVKRQAEPEVDNEEEAPIVKEAVLSKL